MAEEWQSVLQRLEGAYAPRTLSSYRTDVEQYVDWCNTQGLEAFPSSVAALGGFLEHAAETKAASTVKRHTAGISLVLRLMNLPDLTKHAEINLVLRRIKRTKGSRPQHAKGLTEEYLGQFIAVQPDTPVGWRNAAMISLGYDLLARRSELISLKMEHVTSLDDGTLRVIIPRSKSDPFGRGRVTFTSQRSATLLKRWLDWKGADIPYLFCPIYQDVPVNRDLSTTTVVRVIKSAAQKAGIPMSLVTEFSGHSLRVGAAQDLLRRGQSTAAIMRAGGWVTLPNLVRYLEEAEHNVWKE